MKRVRERVSLDASVFDEFPPFLFGAEISNRNLDAYFTRMAVSSLRNYAQDAERGVSFQNSHNTDELGMGRSISGQYDGDDTGGRVLAQFYTVPGIRLGSVLTDDLIMGIRTGLVSDVSIGFYGGKHICGLCEQDLYRSNCPHIPGFEYDVDDPNDPKIKRVTVATATIEDANLAEVSAVYDGATPGAAIYKAQQELDAGRLQPKQARALEARYRIKLPGSSRMYAGIGEGSMTAKREAEVTTVTTSPAAATLTTEPAPTSATDSGELITGELLVVEPDLEPEVRALLITNGAPEKIDMHTAIRFLQREVKRMQPLAADGTDYRNDLVSEAIVEGVRAGMDEASCRTVLQPAPLASIKSMRDSWRKLGDKNFTGGRKTVDGSDVPEQPTPPSHPKTNDLPDEAFMA